MKVEIKKPIVLPEFQPFTLEIKIETPSDLFSLWARFNFPHNHQKDMMEKCKDKFAVVSHRPVDFDDIFTLLDKEAIAQNIRYDQKVVG